MVHNNGSSLPQKFWLLWIGSILNQIGNCGLPFLSFFLISRGISANLAAASITFWGAGGLCASMLGGIAADAIGRKRTLILGLVSFAVAMALIPVVTSLLLTWVLTFLGGLAVDLQRPTVAALISDITNERNRKKAFSLKYWATNLGATVAPLIGATLAGLGYRWIFVFCAGTAILYAILVALGIKETLDRKAARFRIAAAVFLDRKMIGTLIVSAVVMGLLYQMYSTLPIVLQHAGHTPSEYGIVVATTGLTVLLLSVPVTQVMKRFPSELSVGLGAVTVGVGWTMQQAAPDILSTCLNAVIWTIGEIAFCTAAPVLICEFAPTGAQGFYQGLNFMSWNIGSTIGPMAGSFILMNSNSQILWATCGLIGVSSGFAYLFSLKDTRTFLLNLLSLSR